MYQSIRTLAPLAAAAIFAVGACAYDEAEVGEIEQPGQNLNGQNLNGQNLNGSSLGSALAHVSFAGAKLAANLLDALWLEGSQLVGRKGSSIYRGTALLGVELSATSDTGLAVRLRVTGVVPPSPGDDVWRYDVEYRDDDLEWYSICADGTGQFPAVPIAGYWDRRQGVAGGGGKIADPTRFTFACSSLGTVGKCVDIGYHPWDVAGGVALDLHHQACVRLLRNDYCGDGTPHTTEGRVVNLYDAVGVQADTESWIIEAEWDASGARCFSPYARGLVQLPCYRDNVSVGCGSPANFALGTLLMSERPLEDMDGM